MGQCILALLQALPDGVDYRHQFLHTVGGAPHHLSTTNHIRVPRLPCDRPRLLGFK
jgi:hypothetical protein